VEQAIVIPVAMRRCTLPTMVQILSDVTAIDEYKIELAAEILRSGGRIQIKALGTSMLPTIWPGDILQIESKPWDELAVGDVVLVKREKSVLIHRLMKNGGPQWVTRGDAMPQDDPAVAVGDVLGRVAQIERCSRATEPRRSVLPVQRVFAWVLCRWHIFRGLALRAHALRCERGLHQIAKTSLGRRGGSQAN
jgi:signal peptidase I